MYCGNNILAAVLPEIEATSDNQYHTYLAIEEVATIAMGYQIAKLSAYLLVS